MTLPSEYVLQAHHHTVAAVVAYGIADLVGASLDVVRTDLHGLIRVPVHSQGMQFALGIARLASRGADGQLVILHADGIVAVEYLPGPELFIGRFDGVELGAVELVDARLTSKGVGHLSVAAAGVDIVLRGIGFQRAARVQVPRRGLTITSAEGCS